MTIVTAVTIAGSLPRPKTKDGPAHPWLRCSRRIPIALTLAGSLSPDGHGNHANIDDGIFAAAQRIDAPADVGSVPDPQLVAEMKHEINVLVQEITQLAAQDISQEQFYCGFLTRVVSAMGAIGGVVWTISENGQVKLGYQINLAQTGVDASVTSRSQHARLLKTAIEQAQAVIILPNSGLPANRAAANPTELLLLLAPLIVDGQAQRWSRFFSGRGARQRQRGYLRFLVQMAELAGAT